MFVPFTKNIKKRVLTDFHLQTEFASVCFNTVICLCFFFTFIYSREMVMFVTGCRKVQELMYLTTKNG